MKAGFNGLKGKELSLISIVLMSTTIIILVWEKTHGLIALVPPQTEMQIFSEILSSVSDEEAKHLQEAKENHGTLTLPIPTKNEAKRKQEKRRQKSGSLQSGSLVNRKEDRNWNNATENKTKENHGTLTLPIPTKNEAKRKQEKTSKQEEHRQDFVRDSLQSGSLVNRKEGRNWNNATENKVCNYAKGKWVPDDHRPLYSGFGCKQWLSGMWACRLTQRTDFAYEKLRWQPKDCQMEEFEGSKFLRRMQHKTLAFVGDSLGRQQFQSLMCMITGGEETHDVEDVGEEYGLALREGAARPNGWAYHFLSTNTTILYYWSATLGDVEPIDVKNPGKGYALHLDRPPAFLHQYLHKFDVLLLNTGHHWNRGKFKANRFVMHVGGVPNTNKKLAVMWVAKNLTVHSVVSWVNSQLPKYPGLKVFYRTISPRHFVGGEWNTGGSCDNTTPMSVGKEILKEESTDQVAAKAVKGTRVKLLDITALSQLRDEGHISRFSITAKPGVQDCLHWCLPGIPDTWNEILFAQI